MALILVAVGAILLWFLIAPFLKPAPSSEPGAVDPRVTCSICDELREPEEVIERELGAGRYSFICGACIRAMEQDFIREHGHPPIGAPADSPQDTDSDAQ